jgi:hypothetical protein
MVRESQRVILRWQSCVCRLFVISDLALVLGFPLPFIWKSFAVWRLARLGSKGSRGNGTGDGSEIVAMPVVIELELGPDMVVERGIQ